MNVPERPLPPNLVFHDAHPPSVDCHSEVLAGLTARPKHLDPKWFYDERGSQLFEEITRLPEYYPTRAEMSILRSECDTIAARCGAGCVFIEPGAGNCEKATLLLDALRPSAFVPLDISADFLVHSAAAVGRDFPDLSVTAICADFADPGSYEHLLPEGRRVVFYPGSTIGNLSPDAALEFLRQLRRLIGERGGVVIGVDLHKSTPVLEAAYNDSAGVTAAFNRNILARLNTLVGTDFQPGAFSHAAHYDADQQRIEMHLVSDTSQTVRLGDREIHFAPGETIHTENSYKYTVAGFSSMAARAGLQRVDSWFDSERLFSLHYLEPC